MKNLIIIIFVLSFLLPVSAQGQAVTWSKYYDYNNWSNYGRQVIQTFDGGYAFYSETSISDFNSKKNIYFVKTDSLGNIEYEKFFTDPTALGLYPTAFQQTKDSGYILTGIAENSGFLMKIDRFGNISWRKDYIRPETSVRIWTMNITQDNGYICGGDILSSNIRQYILKTDSLGNKQWDSVYLGFRASDIIQSSNGFYYVANGNIFRKLNSNGGIEWERDSSVSALKIIEHPNGYLYILKGVNLSKYDSLGNIYWKKSYYSSFPAYVNFQNFCLSSNGDLILAGYLGNPYTIYPDCFIARIDTEGLVKNYNIIQTGKEDHEYLESIYPTLDNGFISTGGTSYAGSTQYWNTLAVKMDSSFKTSAIVNIQNTTKFISKDFNLFQNYPNPFNPVTAIKFYLFKSSFVNLNIYDISGKLVSNLINREYLPGEYNIEFDGTNFSTGIYYYSLVTEYFSDVKKMVLLK